MNFNPFIPKLLIWTILSLDLDWSIVANKDMSEIKNRMTNSEDPDETACYKPSHLDLQCLQRLREWQLEIMMRSLITSHHVRICTICKGDWISLKG